MKDKKVQIYSIIFVRVNNAEERVPYGSNQSPHGKDTSEYGVKE